MKGTKLFKYSALSAVAVILYLASRLYNIMALPLFTDEAIYTRWAQIAKDDAAWRFISLTDGKQPSFIWADLFMMKFVEDPLLAGRLVSVGAGLLTLFGIYFLARELFKNEKIGLIAAAIYLVYPFALVYDRLAIYDSFLAATMVWIWYLQVLLLRKVRLDVALILAMAMGAGVLTKTSAFFSVYLFPAFALLFNFKQNKWKHKFFRLTLFAFIAVILTYGYYSILRLSPFFHIIEEKNAIFVYPFSEWVEHPFRFFLGNLRGLVDWATKYLTIPITFLIPLAFIAWAKDRFTEKLLMLILFSAPFVALALFGKVLYPRFIFFMTLPLIVLAAYSLTKITDFTKNIYLKFILVIIFLLPMMYKSYFVINDFANAPIPYADLEQYINGWPAGGGVEEMVKFMKDKAEKEPIFVATEGTFGSLPTYAIEIYLRENENIEHEDFFPVPKTLPKRWQDRANTMPTYIVFNQSQTYPDWPMTQVAEYQKGIGDVYMRIFRIEPSR